jgi:hypothetical protein
MFDHIINLNQYLGHNKIREDFGLLDLFLPKKPLVKGGDTTDIKDSMKVKKTFETNQKIDRSMVVNSLNKLVNNVSNDVIQKNTAIASSAVGASNLINISGIQCDEVVITGIRQKADATSQTQVKMAQSNASKISTEISNSIDKTVEKIGNTDIGKLDAQNNKDLEEFSKRVPEFNPNKAQQLASNCPKSDDASLVSVGNKCNVQTSYELDETVKKALELDESFKINDTNDVSNEIKNKIEQTNFSQCSANASAGNVININDILCSSMNASSKANRLAVAEKENTPISKSLRGRLEISDIEQEAIAKLYMTCVFDQKNVSDIANKMLNKITQKYNQIYDAIWDKAQIKGPEYYAKAGDFLDTLVGAGMEKIHAAAGNLEERKEVETPQMDEPVPPTQPTPSLPVQPTPSKPTQPTPSQPSQTTPSKPAQTTPVQPTPSKTAQPAQPAQPAQTTPSKPVQTTPSQTAQTKNNQDMNILLYSGIVIVIFIIIIAIFLIYNFRDSEDYNDNEDDE